MAITLSSQGVVTGAFGTFTAGMGHGTTNYYSAVVLMKLDESGPFDLTTLMPSSGGSVSISGTPTVNLGTIAGAATATLQSSMITALGTPMQQTGGTVTVTGVVPLPNGAATAANQVSSIAQESIAATALGAPADAAWVSGSGSAIALLKKIASVGIGAVTVADGANVTQGAIADAAWSGSGNSTLVAALKAIYGKVAGVLSVGQSGTWTVQPGNTANTTAWKVDGSAVTQPVSGTVTANIGTVGTASTAANQTSQITQETATATALGAPADIAWVSGSGSVVALLKKIAAATGAITVADGADTTQGAIADAAWSGSGSSSVVAALKAIYAKVAGVIGVSQSGTWTVQIGNTPNTTAIKVDGSAVTQPVTGTFFQATQPVSAASLPLPAGAATQTTVAAINTTLGTPMQQTGGTVGTVGSASFSSAQITVGTIATLIAAARAGRNAVTIINEGAVVTRIGNAGVTTANGAFMAGVIGTSMTIPTAAAVYGVVASSTNAVSVIETF